MINCCGKYPVAFALWELLLFLNLCVKRRVDADRSLKCSSVKPLPSILNFRHFFYYMFSQGWQLHCCLDKNSSIVNIRCCFIDSDLSQWTVSPQPMKAMTSACLTYGYSWQLCARSSAKPWLNDHYLQWQWNLDLHSHCGFKLWKH